MVPPVGRPFQPDYAIVPGETVTDVLEKRDMTQTQLAKRLGVSIKHVNQVVNGQASISAALALGLEKVLGVPAGFWLNRESLYRADLARRGETALLADSIDWAKQFPIREMKKRRLIPAGADGPDLVRAVLGFFGVASPEQWSDPAVAYRKSQRFESDYYALAAWLRLGEREAADIPTEPYSNDRFLEVLSEIRGLTRLSPRKWHKPLIRLSASAGVAVAVVPHFEAAKANGASRWLSPTKALIQLSLRHKWEDIFWFSFFHEAGHIVMQHRKKELFIDGSLFVDGLKRGGLKRRPDHDVAQFERYEDEADRFAARILIPSEFDRHLRRLTLAEVEQFAEQIGVSPAIVIGRLQHDGRLPYSSGNRLRRRLEFTQS